MRNITDQLLGLKRLQDLGYSMPVIEKVLNSRVFGTEAEMLCELDAEQDRQNKDAEKDARQRRIDQICRHADRLEEIARVYSRLRWMAHEDETGAFLDLAEAAGRLTIGSLEQMARLLDMLAAAENATRREPQPPWMYTRGDRD